MFQITRETVDARMTVDAMDAALAWMERSCAGSGTEFFIYDESAFRDCWLFVDPTEHPCVRHPLRPRIGILGDSHTQCQRFVIRNYGVMPLELYACEVVSDATGAICFVTLVLRVGIPGAFMAVSLKNGHGLRMPFAMWVAQNQPSNELRCRVREPIDAFLRHWDEAVARRFTREQPLLMVPRRTISYCGGVQE